MHARSLHRPHAPAGITLLEAMFATLIFVGAALVIYRGMNHGYLVSLQSRAESEGNLRAVRRLEEVSLTAYDGVVSNSFPVQYVTDGEGLVYALTTTITKVYYPYEHKQIHVDYTWREGAVRRHVNYFTIKSP